MSELVAKEIIYANREKLWQWNLEGKSYFWMALAIGLSNRNPGAISHWFLAQGIRRKAAR